MRATEAVIVPTVVPSTTTPVDPLQRAVLERKREQISFIGGRENLPADFYYLRGAYLVMGAVGHVP